jgi:hypothetical protein
MLQTIEGIYSNGQVIFTETPPEKKDVKIFITFTEEKVKPKVMKKRELGMFAGLIKVPSDFNDPIEDLKDYM